MPPRPRPGAAAGRSNPMPEAWGSSQEDQPHVQGTLAAWAQEGLEELSHGPKPEARGSGPEDQPHVQGAVAAWEQEGLEELSHVEGQEGRQ